MIPVHRQRHLACLIRLWRSPVQLEAQRSLLRARHRRSRPAVHVEYLRLLCARASTRRTTSQAPAVQEQGQDVPLIDLAGLDTSVPDLALSPDGAARGGGGGGASVYSMGSGAFDPFADLSGVADARLEPGLGAARGRRTGYTRPRVESAG